MSVVSDLLAQLQDRHKNERKICSTHLYREERASYNKISDHVQRSLLALRNTPTIQWAFFMGQHFHVGTICCIRENFRELNFCGGEFSKFIY